MPTAPTKAKRKRESTCWRVITSRYALAVQTPAQRSLRRRPCPDVLCTPWSGRSPELFESGSSRNLRKLKPRSSQIVQSGESRLYFHCGSNSGLIGSDQLTVPDES